MLEGEVVFYNEEDGEGAIVAKNKQKFKFDVIDWDDFDNSPEVGLEVKFKDVGERAKKIKKLIKSQLFQAPSETLANMKKVEVTTNSKSAKVSLSSSEEDKEKINRAKKLNEENEATITRNIFRSVDKEIASLKVIKVTVPVSQCIKDFFADLQDIVDEKYEVPEEGSESSRTLDYQRMKRFLTTAYHHLTDRDPDFTDEKFNGLKLELANLGNSQVTLASMSKHPQTKFEKVFLSRQPEFISIQKKFVTNQKSIDSFSINIRSLEHTIREKEKMMKKMKVGSEEYNYMEMTLKNTKRKYADLLDTVANLKEINRHIRELKDKFVKEHFQPFMDQFDEKAKDLNGKMKFIVNRAAYEFDTYMWQKARKSSSIKQFFLEAQIDGTFSSKTFLKYFINTLDLGKLNSANQDLVKLLRYLESIETKSIMIINEKSSVLTMLSYIANGINKDYRVVSVQTPIDFYNRVKKENPDIVIIDTDIRQFGLEEFVNDVRDKAPKDVTVCLTSEKFTKPLIAKAKKLNIKHLIYLNSTESEIQKKLKDIIQEDMLS
jgi:Leucine-rich repeat (LRR) protein